jgi:molybdenum cofactor cytidylyltransferase
VVSQSRQTYSYTGIVPGGYRSPEQGAGAFAMATTKWDDAKVATAGVLLAAGGGTRFVGPEHKLRADAAGRPLVSYALDALAGSGLPLLVVVTGAVDLDDLLPAGVISIANPDWEGGQATSLASAVAWARPRDIEAIVIGLGDQPGVTAASWTAVAGVSATAIAIATYGGRRGHPVRLAREVWDRLPTEGDAGARSLIGSAPALVTEVPCVGDPADVDTIEDLARWR